MIEGFAREMPEDRDGRGDHGRPIGYVGELCDLQQELIAKVGAKKKEFVPPPRRRPVRRAHASSSTTGSSTAKQTAGKQARADAVEPLEGAGHGRADSRSDGRGRLHADVVLARPGTTWKQHVVRDLILARHAPRRPRPQDAAADRVRGRPAAARPRLGPVPTRRDAGARSPSRSAPAATSSASTACSTSTRSSSCSTTTSRRSRSAKCGRSAARAAARSATARWPSGA